MIFIKLRDCLSVLLPAIQNHLLDRFVLPKLESLPRKSRIQFARAFLIVLLTIVAGAEVVLYLTRVSVALLILNGLVVSLMLTVLISLEVLRLRLVLIISGLSLGFGLAFGIGVDFARNELSSELPLNKISIGEKGKEAETEVSARIIRAGERGVLYFDPKSAQFGLIPWESIKRIDWLRSPLINAGAKWGG